jgi:hypothetical protein
MNRYYSIIGSLLPNTTYVITLCYNLLILATLFTAQDAPCYDQFVLRVLLIVNSFYHNVVLSFYEMFIIILNGEYNLVNQIKWLLVCGVTQVMDNFRRGLHSFFVTGPKMYQLY